jgi:hypothetical protein
MKALNILYHLARADFLERTRRYSFLIMLGLVLYLGYLVNIGQITLRLETYRGVFNSAWVGSMMTLVVNFLLGWFGFYLVKNSIVRDYETGVGQIMATTPLSRPIYLLGKWLSNFVVLDFLVLILMLAAVVMQFIQREAPQINFWALSAPFLFVALPFMALVAALAVFFESISWLRGSFGNVVYFFLFILVIAMVAIMFGGQVPLLDWLGFGIFKSSMAVAAKAAFPAYQGGLALSMVPASGEIQPFEWAGVAWTLSMLWPRLATFALAIGLTLLSAVFFDRFDTSGARLRSKKTVPGVNEPSTSAELIVTTPELKPVVRLTPLATSQPRFRFGTLFLAELQLLLKGLPWWWYLVAIGLIAASGFLPLKSLRQNILPAALIWPLLVWSGLGCRETQRDTRQMIFSAPRPLWNQIPVAWLAGFMVALLMGGGTLVRFGLAGDIGSKLSLMAGLLFIPSLALMLGVWTGSSKAFEVVYVVFWYLGLLNKVLELDYVGLHTPGNWQVYSLLSIALFFLALIGRQQQLKN